MYSTKSEQKMAEIAIKSIVEALPGHVYWKNTQGVYLGCNEPQAKALGFSSPDLVIGKTDHDLSPKELADEFRKIDLQIMETRQEQLIEEKSGSGQKGAFLSHKKPLFDKKNNVIGVVGITLDITERKRAEEDLKKSKEAAESALAVKNEFLENMRHDIRTPLSGIIGFAEIIRQEAGEDHPQFKEYANNLITSGNSLLKFLNEVLESLKISSNEQAIRCDKFDLRAELQKVVDLYQSLAHNKKLHLSLSHAADIPKYLIGDAGRIYRILLELLANALTFTKKGSVIIKTQLAKIEGQKSVIKITVKDTGEGIAKEHYQDIFTRFKRLTPSCQGKYKGAGLGLFTVRQYIDDLEAEIYVNSVPEQGTTFTCVIPLQVPLIEEPLGLEEVSDTGIRAPLEAGLPLALISAPVTSGKSILLVEDDAFAATVAASLLNHYHCQVDLACDGETAIKKAKEKQYDLMLLDIGLPDMPGYEVARKIRELKNQTAVPMVALTAHVEPEQERFCFDAGISQIMNKPLTREKVKTLLASDILEDEQLTRKFIDISSLEKNLGFKGTDLIGFLVLFDKSLSKELPFIEVAYQKKDWAHLKRLIHKMKGGAMICGAVRLQKACEFLEERLSKKKPDALASSYQGLLKEVQRAKLFLKGFFAEQGTEVTV